MENYSTLEYHDRFVESCRHTPQAFPTPVQDRRAFQDSTTLNSSHVVPADRQHLSQKQVVAGGCQDPKHDNTPGGSEVGADEKKQQKVTITSLSRRNFIIYTGLVFVTMLGIVLGAVLGTLLPHDDDTEAQTQHQQARILDTSRLSASNFTSYDGIDHRLVYFQDEYEHLICRRWNSDTNGWVTLNITQSSSAPHKPYRGSTIASAPKQLDSDSAPEIFAQVFFLDGESIIRSYEMPYAEKEDGEFRNNDMEGWEQRVLDQSELAATYQGGNDDEGNPFVRTILAFQDPNGSVYVANESDWANTTMAIPADEINGGPTPLALGPYWKVNSRGLQIDWQTTGPSSGIQFRGFLSPDYPTWTPFDIPVSIHNLNSSASVLSQHMTFCRLDNMEHSSLLLRQSNGQVKMNYYDGENEPQIDQVIFNNGSSNSYPKWGSIASAHGGFFYGIADNGRILEYQVGDLSRGIYNFVSQVYP